MVDADNFFYVAGGTALSVIGAITLATGLNPSVQADQQHAATVKQLQATRQKEAEQAALERKTANARYENGCVLLQKQLVEGQQVYSVPAETIVCDVFGLTGRLTKSGTVTDVVRTPDQTVVQQRISQ